MYGLYEKTEINNKLLLSMSSCNYLLGLNTCKICHAM